MNFYKKLVSDSVIFGLGTFGSKLLVFLLMPFYTAWLSTEEYGTAELITATANLLIPLACVGVTNAIFRFVADKESDQSAVFSSGVALLLCGLGGFLILSPLLLISEYLSAYLWLIVAYVFFADVQAVCAQYVRAIDRTRLFAVQGILNTLLTILFNILFLVVGKMGVTGYVLSVVVGNILTTLFLIVAVKLWRVFSWKKIERRLMGEMLRFCLPLIPTTVCWLITDLSDRYLVTYFRGSDVNGVYSAAYKIPTIVNLISGIFLQAWQFSAVAASVDEASCRKFYSNVYNGFLSLVMIGSSGLILLSGLLTKLLLNQTYHEAWRYMPTLLCAAALEAIVSFLATVYLVRKKSMHSFLTALLGAVLNLILNLWWIPSIGALGAALATLVSYGAVLLARMIDVPRILPFRLRLPRLCADIALLLSLAAVMTFAPPYKLLWASLLTVALVAVNAPMLIRSLKQFLRKT